ncbi:MAG TPA: hypothetical protein VNB49_12885 [Candidatus Dormibacteraeota bacterium]|nr:hypothetical protein [Candidatus Dormibacteraeota bacterium]
MIPFLLALRFPEWQPHFSFLTGAEANEMIALRLLHFIFGIIWIGLLYFFNLVLIPAMKQYDPALRTRIYPELMRRAMAWFRWSALITVLVGLRYFGIHLFSDARLAGNPALGRVWFRWWLLVWILAYALIYALQLPAKGFFNNPVWRVLAISA